MSRRLLRPMPESIVANQRAASDPAQSVWVAANAGSGKTYVLTARVLRLLLSGVQPDEILCLTYTKAAAAEMRTRVSERLARWSLADEGSLRTDLTALEGTPPTPNMELRARSLFAHALDTPGGLKVQTIHAFCESVLHRFPREAGIPFDFTVVEDFERDAMLQTAREQIIAAGLRGSGEAAAVETLFGLLSDFSIEQSIIEALNQQPILRRVLADLPTAKRTLRRLVAAGSREDVLTQVIDGYPLTADEHALVAGFSDLLDEIDPRRPDPDALFDAFLTQADRTARARLLKKADAAQIPDIARKLMDEAARLEGLHIELTRATLIERSEAMLDLLAAISAHYEEAKRARSLLDFDDLIERTSALLGDEGVGAWVRYKLDAAISHILVDEGQDTSIRQWDVVSTLIAEFFQGESAAIRPRTLFVVGDQKQSIFSFQGADPEVFVSLGRQLSYSARAVQLDIRKVPLHTSFRTLPNVLRAVDAVFTRPDLKDAILEDTALVHDTARAEGGGQVTLWPPAKEIEEPADPDNWPDRPADFAAKSAPRRVAERIAREIKGWISTPRMLGPRGRAVAPDDVLILVQVRSVLFHEIIRALIRERIPTPGADRLGVTTHLGVLDLMALGDVLSNSSDDLQLAALLRSPLFDVSEKDLLDVAQPRAENETLWSAMKRSDIASVREAYRQLSDWRNRLDFERPFNFYADVLYAGGGLKRFRQRFGAEIDDVAAEFLDLALAHEHSAQPSLIGFLAELRSRDVTIKRELAEGGGVRVMTVHGAKGLEAPIVILADAASTEEGRDRRSIYMGLNPPLFFHAPSKASHATETMDHKDAADAAQKAEYWRKLYVAMTRAEDELYVTGYLTKARDGKGSWYEAIEGALQPLSRVETDATGEPSALVFPAEAATSAATTVANDNDAARAEIVLPELPHYRLRRIVRPSSAFADAVPEDALETTVERLSDPRDPEAARKEGIALHALLQHLGRIDPGDRPAVSLRALQVLLPNAADRHAAMAEKAASILGRRDLAHLFGPDSRAEVPILARGARNGQPITIAGRIDRLVVTAEKVLIVDFKSDGQAPDAVGAVPKGYLVQLGLYALVAGQLFPGRAVETAILWTGPESLMNLPAQVLLETVSGFTIG